MTSPRDTAEHALLRDTARALLADAGSLGWAREALDGATVADLWAGAVDAGWSGLLVTPHDEPDDLAAAMIVAEECGRGLAATPLLGQLCAGALLGESGEHRSSWRKVVDGELRAAVSFARRPATAGGPWTVAAPCGAAPEPAPRFAAGRLDGRASWVPDAGGAQLILVVTDDGCAVAVDPAAPGIHISTDTTYDPTGPLSHLVFDGAHADRLGTPVSTIGTAWDLAQAILAAQEIGVASAALDLGVDYVRHRFAFGRPIGSFQSVKHTLVEALRLIENARSMLLRLATTSPLGSDFRAAAAATRLLACRAAEAATRTCIAVHGGIGATWEHDAHLYFRRAQQSTRLVGGQRAAADDLAALLLAGPLPEVA